MHVLTLLSRLFPTISEEDSGVPIELDRCAEAFYRKNPAGSQDNPDDHALLDPNFLASKIRQWNWDQGGEKYSFGGYMEDRSNLWRGHYMMPDKPIHVGVDFNVGSLTTVCLPHRGKLLHSWYDEDFMGGWGGKMLFRINTKFVIFAHLEPALMIQNHGPDPINVDVGEPIGVIGRSTHNGGWYPHLHIQVVSSLDDVDADGYHAPSADLVERFPDPVEYLRLLEN